LIARIDPAALQAKVDQGRANLDAARAAVALHHFQEILKGAELPKIRFYDLRHTHASLLIAEGVHPKKIAERLGHASIKLTMDTYGHLFEGSDRESAERMERLFGRTEEPKSHADTKVIRIDRRGADVAQADAADFLLTKTGRSADKKHRLPADKTADKNGLAG